jgi:hypothetical protein
LKKVEQQYLYDENERFTMLQAAVVTAEQKTPRSSPYYSRPDQSITEEALENVGSTTMANLLMRFPGVQLHRDPTGGVAGVIIRGGFGGITPPSSPSPPLQFNRQNEGNEGDDAPGALLIVDGVPCHISYLNMLSVHDIAQIDLLKSAINTSIFGLQGGGGVISIHTKIGGHSSAISTNPFHIKTITPLGYQQPAEFYAPKYETALERSHPKPDLRTTIHWQPVVNLNNSGEAMFEFYTADETASYTVTIEGVGSDGEIIQKTGKIKTVH